MHIWRMLGNLIVAMGLMEVLSGKKITTLDGTILGVVVDIKLDSMLGKIWVMVDGKEHGDLLQIPIPVPLPLPAVTRTIV